MRNGQVIMPGVIEGICRQDIPCGLVPITSKYHELNHYRFNIMANWNEAFKCHNSKIFIGMDSDVVMLSPWTIRSLIQELNLNLSVTMVTCPTKESHTPDKKGTPPHSLFAIRSDELIPILSDNKLHPSCPICILTKNLQERGKVIKTLWDLKAIECKRMEVKSG